MMLSTTRLRALAAVLVALVLFPLVSGCDGDDPIAGIETDVTVMTRNLYLGADLFTLFAAQTAEELPPLVAQLYGNVLASDFPARAAAIVREIQVNDPDLVGLQEVSLYRTQTPGDYVLGNDTTNATNVTLDFLRILQDSLAARGLVYTVVATNTNADVELPSTTDGMTFTDIRLTDRDVILAKQGLTVGAAISRNFFVEAPVEVAGATINFVRGYSFVPVTKDGVSFMFANAHLEVGGDPAVQAQIAQATELSGPAGLGDLDPPVVLVGDFNSDPEDAGDDGESYRILTASYTDAWAALRAGDDGPTCCHDADLMNPASVLDSRIDLVLFRGDVTAQSVGRVGDDPLEQTPTGLWPSDHAGVVATLRVSN